MASVVGLSAIGSGLVLTSQMMSGWGVKQKMEYSAPKKGMEHVVGQLYHHYDFPLTQKDMELRDSVYIISLWRNDAKIKYKNKRLLRKFSKNQVHDIIKFHTGIDENSSKALTQHLQYLNSISFDTGKDEKGHDWIQPIWLEIMSPGGSVQDGIEMRSVVEASRRPVVPIISGLCASAATFMFTANQNCRLMQGASILLIHQMSQNTGYGQQLKQIDWETETRNMDIWQSQIEQFYYGLKRPKEYKIRRTGPNSETARSDFEGAVMPLEDGDSEERGMRTRDVKSLEKYRKKVQDLMKGIDRYMPSIEALKYGFATGIFTTWKEQEEDPNSPAFCHNLDGEEEEHPVYAEQEDEMQDNSQMFLIG